MENQFRSSMINTTTPSQFSVMGSFANISNTKSVNKASNDGSNLDAKKLKNLHYNQQHSSTEPK